MNFINYTTSARVNDYSSVTFDYSKPGGNIILSEWERYEPVQTIHLRCEHCGPNWKEDMRGNCKSCGAPG